MKPKHLTLAAVNGQRTLPLSIEEKFEAEMEAMINAELAFYAALSAVQRHGAEK